jgi:primase-polymerase (primpol)-like protein
MESGGGLEIYDRLRYMTMTGNRLAGTSETIEERENEIAQFHERHFSKMPRSDRTAIKIMSRGLNASGGLNDDELLAKARMAKNHAKFCALYDRGDISAYASTSEGDLALCAILAFWAGPEAEQIDRLFRRSALFRQKKWDVAHFADGQSYGQATIAKAVAGTREFYQANNGLRLRENGSSRSTIALSRAEENLTRPGKWPPGTTGAWPSGKRWVADGNGHPVPIVEEDG